MIRPIARLTVTLLLFAGCATQTMPPKASPLPEPNKEPVVITESPSVAKETTPIEPPAEATAQAPDAPAESPKRDEYAIGLKNFIGDETYTGGASMFVFWDLHKPAVESASRRLKEKFYLSYSPDGGKTWRGKQEIPLDAKRHLWRLPTSDGAQYRVKIYIERDGKVVASTQSKGNFAISTAVARPKLDVVPTTRTGTVQITYTGETAPGAATFIRPDGTSGAHDPVEAILWFTTDQGQSWQKYQSYAADGTKITFSGEDGPYGLYMTLVDDDGLTSPVPVTGTEPMTKLLIDTTEPQVELTAKMGEGDTPSLMIDWKVQEKNLARKPVTLFVSKDNGKSWKVAERDIEHTGHHKLAVDAADIAYRVAIAVKDQAGNITRREATNGVIVDDTPPVTLALGPTVSSSSEMELHYVIRDTGGSGVRQTTLYYSRNEGITWEKYKSFDHGEPIAFVESDGTYGLFLASQDWAGNEEPAPADGIEAQMMVTIQNKAPQIKLNNFIDGGLYRGGTIEEIKWEGSGGFLAELPVTLEFFDGAQWLEIKGQFPRSGSYSWTVPPVDSKLCRVRARITNRHGASASNETPTVFMIDSSAPKNRVGIISMTRPGADRTLQRPVQAQTVAVQVQQTPPDGTNKPNPVKAASASTQPVPPPTPIKTVSAPQLLIQAQQHVIDGKPYLAEMALRKALKLEPNNLEVMSGLAYVLFRQKLHTESEQLYLEIIRRNRTLAEPQYVLGLIYFERESLGETEKRNNANWAEIRFKEALRLDPKHHKARNMLGMVQFRREEHKEALEHFNRAIHDSDGVAIYHFNRATVQFKLNNYEACIESAKAARHFDPKLIHTLWYIAKSYQALGQTDAAIDYWNMAVMAYGSTSEWGTLALTELKALTNPVKEKTESE